MKNSLDLIDRDEGRAWAVIVLLVPVQMTWTVESIPFSAGSSARSYACQVIGRIDADSPRFLTVSHFAMGLRMGELQACCRRLV